MKRNPDDAIAHGSPTPNAAPIAGRQSFADLRRERLARFSA
jgi:hypothetical protein